MMKIKISTTFVLSTFALSVNCQQPPISAPVQWKIHDMSRPKPPVVEPMAQVLPALAPKGAVILFKAGDLSQWKGKGGADAKWKLENDYMEIVPGTGGIESKESFGD